MPLMKAIKTSLAFNLIERKLGYSPEWFTDRRKLRVVTKMDTPKSGLDRSSSSLKMHDRSHKIRTKTEENSW